MCYWSAVLFFFSSRRRHTRCALVTGVQTCALPISQGMSDLTQMDRLASELAGARAVRADAEARSSTIGAASSAGAAASPLLADLQTQEITLQRRIAELSAMYGQIGRAHV